MTPPKKILIIRLSSFGDVLLTSYAIRSIHESFPDAEIDFLTKKQFIPLLEFNPHLRKKLIYTSVKAELTELKKSVKSEKYDLILDWQNNFRSMEFRKYSKKVGIFKKNRISRFSYIHFKTKFNQNQVPIRYLETAITFGAIESDGGLELVVDHSTSEKMKNIFFEWKGHSESPVYFIASGAKHFTKRYPAKYYADLMKLILSEKPETKFILLGGSDELESAKEIKLQFPNNDSVWNAVGGFGIMESCALVKLCSAGFSNDSFLMHVATAFQIPVVAFFGSTTQNLGFSPFRSPSLIVEDNSVSCRPCSHIGKNECPKKHFHCMLNLEPEKIYPDIKKFLKF